MSEQDYILPNRVGRIAGIGCLTCALILLAVSEPLSTWYISVIQSLPTLEAQKTALVVSNGVAAILFGVVSFWLLILGRGSWKSGRWPPKGLPIMFRIRGRVGWRSHVRAALCVAGSVLLAFVVLFFLYLAWTAYGI